MPVVSEKTIRKIISSKIEKSEAINEIGFEKRLDLRLGDTTLIKCDLSNLKNTTFAAKFAKHFIFNPEVTTTTRSESGELDTSVLTKRNLISFLTGLGVSDELDKEYEKIVVNLVRQNPSLIDKYISALENAITLVFGPVSTLYCTALNKMMGFGGDIQSSPTRSEENTETINLAAPFGNAYSKASEEFYRLERLNKNSVFSNEEYMLLYPKTSLNHTGGTRATIGMTDLGNVFLQEDQVLNDIISTDDRRPSRIYSDFEDYVKASISYSNARHILEPIKSFVNSSNEIKNSYEVGDTMRAYLRGLRDNVRENIKRSLGV